MKKSKFLVAVAILGFFGAAQGSQHPREVVAFKDECNIRMVARQTAEGPEQFPFKMSCATGIAVLEHLKSYEKQPRIFTVKMQKNSNTG